MVITVEPPKAIVPVVSVSTTLAALNVPTETPLELVTVTVLNELPLPTLVRVITSTASKVRF